MCILLSVLDTVGNALIKSKKIKFLKKKCCDNELCNLNFIKANCPGTRKKYNTFLFINHFENSIIEYNFVQF